MSDVVPTPLDQLARQIRDDVLADTSCRDMADLAAHYPSVAALVVTLDQITASIEQDFLHVIGDAVVRSSIVEPRQQMGIL